MSARSVRQIACTGIALAMPMLACSCSTEPTSSNGDRFGTNGRPLTTPAGVAQTGASQAVIQPFGPVPYAGLNMPLISPDGRFVATETGVAPRWETVLANENATIPAATTLEIYELVYQPGQVTPPVRRAAVDPHVVMGRACETQGFLVEAPQSDGSRWIGKVDWQTGELDWLVQDGFVNAFATIGSGGKLAWCRRPVDGERFDLVVRHSGGEEWTLHTEGDDWLMPAWSGVGDNLAVVNLNNGVLSLAYLDASSRTAAIQSMLRRVPLASNGSVLMAFQMTTAYPAAVLPGRAARHEVLFHHPVYNRAAVWRPLSGRANDITLLHADSFAAVMVDEDLAIVSTPDEIKQQSLTKRSPDIRLLLGTCVVRPTANATWPYIVLRLVENTPNAVAVTAMQLVRP